MLCQGDLRKTVPSWGFRRVDAGWPGLMSRDGIWSSPPSSRGQKQFLPCPPQGRKIIIGHCIVVFCEKQKLPLMFQNSKAHTYIPPLTGGGAFGWISLSTSLPDLRLHGLFSQAGHCNGFQSAHSITPAFQKRAPPSSCI